MSGEFVLSVVVPTRNRARYALGAIEQILSIDDPGLQLVVHDNSDTDSLRGMCEAYKDDLRFTYAYCPTILSFVANFDAAVMLARGEYICLIGDDDGINPEVLTVARWARDRGVRAVKPGLQISYLWPGAGLPGEADSGQLTVHRISGDVRVSATAPQLTRLLHHGCQQYLDRDLAKLYHGLVHRDALDQVRSTTGRYFGGLSPDIYAAVALSTVVDSVVCLDYPLTVSGICATSGSADSATGRHTGRLEDAPHFLGHDSYQWSELIPRFYSVETIWADSSLAALRDLGRLDLIDLFDPAFLAAYCLVRHPEFGEPVRDHYREVRSLRGMGAFGAGARLAAATATVRAAWMGSRVLRKITGEGKVVARQRDVSDIAAAARGLAGFLKAQGLDVAPCLERLDKLSWP